LRARARGPRQQRQAAGRLAEGGREAEGEGQRQKQGGGRKQRKADAEAERQTTQTHKHRQAEPSPSTRSRLPCVHRHVPRLVVTNVAISCSSLKPFLQGSHSEPHVRCAHEAEIWSKRQKRLHEVQCCTQVQANSGQSREGSPCRKGDSHALVQEINIWYGTAGRR
jgi:hypothetical protein